MIDTVFFVVEGAAVMLATFIIMSLRLRVMYSLMKFNVGLSKILDSTMISSVVHLVTPYGTGTIFVRPFVLKKAAGIPYETSIAVSVVDHAVEIAASAAALVISIFIVSFEYVPGTYMLIFSIPAAALLILVFYSKGMTNVLEKILSIRGLPIRARKTIKRKVLIKKRVILEAVEAIQSSGGRYRALAMMFSLSVLIIVFQPFSTFFFLKSMSIDLSYVACFVVLWLPFTTGRLSHVPGGLGVRELTSIYLLSFYGVPLVEATVASIVLTILVSMTVVLCGLFSAWRTGISIMRTRNIKRQPVIS